MNNVFIVLFFKQKTAYGMRISDWSSDVCSSDLLQLATARLPREVQQSGLIVAKATNSILLAAAIYSEDGSHSVSDMADYVASRVQDPVSRVPGVGDIRVLGGQYAMRIWVDPFKDRKSTRLNSSH